jgi:hypothetical protein
VSTDQTRNSAAHCGSGGKAKASPASRSPTRSDRIAAVEAGRCRGARIESLSQLDVVRTVTRRLEPEGVVEPTMTSEVGASESQGSVPPHHGPGAV